MTGRRPIQAYLSDEARAGWEQLAETHGVSVTALIEAAGLALAKTPKAGEKWVAAARRTDAARRRR